jgi:2-oxoisovalerate dehydrogenase E1 component alpha subunit
MAQAVTSPTPAPAGKLVADFQVRYSRCLDAEGKLVDGPQPPWVTDQAILVPIYRSMLLTRIFDKRALILQRTGRLGTYASPLGQEAIGAAVASAMSQDDVMLPSYREFSAQIHRGVTLKELLLYWGGDERGSDFRNCREDFPACIPIATQALHAVGVASAFVYRKQSRVAVCFIGDGATSKGDFYEAINLAGTWNLPVVFIVSNNEWAISVPRSRQSAAKTLAQKAIAAGFDGEQVDGNDAIAVRWAAERAIENARNNRGPHLIEAMSYRMADHTTADDASRYRDSTVVEKYARLDPLVRLERYFETCGIYSEPDRKALAARCEKDVEQAQEDYLATPNQPVEAMFDYLFASLPSALTDQRNRAIENARGQEST